MRCVAPPGLMLFEPDCPRGLEVKGSCTLRSAAGSRERDVADCTAEDGGGPLGASRQRVGLAHHSRGLLYRLWIAAGTWIMALGLAGKLRLKACLRRG